MRKYILSTFVLAALCVTFTQQAQAQYAYGASGIGYDSATRVVYGYSRTTVDAVAGAYYDPHVEGYLYGPYGVHSAGSARGYENYYPALVETASYTTPSTQYTVISDHYVISWYSVTVEICGYYGFFGGCGYDPYGYNYFSPINYGGFNYFYGPGYGGYVQQRTYYLGSTGISGITPPDDPCQPTSGNPPATAAASKEGTTAQYEATSSGSRDTVALVAESCPVEPPRPTINVVSVGFKGDHKIKRLSDSNVIDPNDTDATWVKNRNDNDKYPVAYTKDTRPIVFASFTVEQANSSYTAATIRVRRSNTVLAQIPNFNVGTNGTVNIDNISLSQPLDESSTVRKKDYEFKWEISYDGSSWRSIGDSDHRIHWLNSAPIEPTFRHSATSDVAATYTGLYDVALEHATGEIGDNLNNIDDVIEKITKGIPADLDYNPGRESPNRNPLLIHADPQQKALQCSDNAELLRGLLRSVGIDGTTNYYWGGNPSNRKAHFFVDPVLGRGRITPSTPVGENVSAQFARPASGVPNTPLYIASNPHFSFHATATADSGKSYDPSYGIIEPEVKVVQAVNAARQCVGGAAANNLKVTSTGLFDGGIEGMGDPCRGPALRRSAGFVAQSVPAYMDAGQTYSASVTLKNTGSETWTQADLYRLGSQNPQDNLTWGVGRIDVPASVPPDGEVTFNFTIYAPAYSGTCNFQWRMVQDGVEWFGDPTPNVQIDVYQQSCYTDPWLEQDCRWRGGWWGYNTCTCQGLY